MKLASGDMSNEKSIRLNSKQIMDLVHYANVIPISKGLSQKYVEDNYPGWEWNDIIPVLFAKGVLVKDETPGSIQLGAGIFMDKKIGSVTIYFDSKNIDVD